MKKRALLSFCLFSSLVIAKPFSQQALDGFWQNKPLAAETIVQQMSTAEKIGQLLMLDFRYWGTDSQGEPIPLTTMNQEVAEVIHRYHLGAVILFRENLIHTSQTVALIQAIQAARSNLPLLIGTDQEGGYVTRLRVGTEMPGNMALGATRNADLAELTGMIHGHELTSLGFNINFGPVVDVNSHQNNPIIGVRAYSDHHELVQLLSTRYIKGIHRYPLLTAIKHFPGHGNVTSDSHIDLPIVTSDKTTWRNTVLPPFTYALSHGADAVMTAHIIVPALDNHQITTLSGQQVGTPATLSKPILEGILRKRLHFDGLIFTDAMDMGAISDNFDINWAVKTALLAGADIILMPIKMWDQQAVKRLDVLYQSLLKEAQHNPILRQRIDESAKRVILKKLTQQITATPVSRPLAEAVVASKIHKDIENWITEKAITLIKNEQVLPYTLKAHNHILVVSDEQPRNDLINKLLQQIADETAVTIQTKSAVVKLSDQTLNDTDVLQLFDKQALVLLVTYNLSHSPANAQLLIDKANQMGIPLVVIASRNPYDIAYLKQVKANIAIYGITGFDITNQQRNALETNIRGGLRTLFSTPEGKPLNPPTGQLPVDIKHPENATLLYPYGHGETYDMPQ